MQIQANEPFQKNLRHCKWCEIIFYFIGTVLLDLESYDLPSIYESVVENMVITDQLSRANKGKVVEVLLSKHRHQHQQSRLKRNFSFSSLSSFTMDHANTPRDKDSGIHSNVDMEIRQEGETDKVIGSNDIVLNDLPSYDVAVASLTDGAVKEHDVTTKGDSVVFEIGDVDIDEEDNVGGAEASFLKESYFGDSSDDERVCSSSLYIVITRHCTYYELHYL